MTLGHGALVQCSFVGCTNSWDLALATTDGRRYTGAPLIDGKELASRFGRPIEKVPASVERVEHAYSALGPDDANWYHSLIDQGALIAQWDRSGLRRQGVKLVLSSYWYYRWPELPNVLGLASGEYVWMNYGRIEFERMTVPVQVRGWGRNSLGEWSFADPADVAHLRDIVLRNLGPNSEYAGTCIAVDRSDGWRAERVQGYSALLQELVDDFGFKAVRLGELKPEQQLRLFRDARLVVGEHGAGLSGMLAISPGTSLIEIYPNSNRNLGVYGFAFIAECLQHSRHYRYVASELHRVPSKVRDLLRTS